MKHFVGPVRTTEDYTAECDFFHVVLDRDYVRTLLDRMAKVKSLKSNDHDICQVEWWDFSIDAYAWPDCESSDEAGELMDLGASILDELPVSFTEEGMSRIECTQCVVYEDSLYWSFIPKHTSIELTTETIVGEELEKLLKELDKAD